MSEARDLSNPRPGWFQTRLVSKGPLVPARIFRECHCTPNGGDDNDPHDWAPTCDRHPPLVAEIDGNEVEVEQVWAQGTEIDEDRYAYLVAGLAHDRAIGSTAGQIYKPLDLETINPERFLP